MRKLLLPVVAAIATVAIAAGVYVYSKPPQIPGNLHIQNGSDPYTAQTFSVGKNDEIVFFDSRIKVIAINADEVTLLREYDNPSVISKPFTLSLQGQRSSSGYDSPQYRLDSISSDGSKASISVVAIPVP